MGVSLSFDFVQRDEKFIVGRLPSLKMYEAKLSLVQENYFDLNDGLYLKSFGYIICEFEINAGGSYGYYRYPDDCYFITMANLLYGRDDLNSLNRTIYLYEPECIKKGIGNVIKYASKFKGSFSDQERYNEDMIKLKSFYQKLIQYETKNALISCSI